MKMSRLIFTFAIMTLSLTSLCSCRSTAPEAESTTTEPMPWVVDKFDDIKVLRYEVPGFEKLPLQHKTLIYYLAQATKAGRDILFDQNFKYNLTVRRTLEAIYNKYDGDRADANFVAMEKYLKKVWFANGIHHHYSNDKFRPEFSREWFAEAVGKYVDPQNLPIEKSLLLDIIFDPALYAKRLNQTDGVDMVTESACNYYEGVTMKEVDDFYTAMRDNNDPTPISYGLNSKLMKDEQGNIVEKVWKLGGMYSAAIEQIIFWLEKAAQVAEEPQKSIINALVNYYRTGNLREFDRYNILWVGDNESNVDFVNGFIEDYGDPLGRKASWEGTVNFIDSTACRRTQILSANAQWFEDNAPIDPKFRKKEVKGVSAKVITVAMLGGDCFPSTPIGINLPNADWIRKEYGSKSVTIDNITYAYDKAAQGNGFNEEFMLRAEDRERIAQHGKLSDDLHTDLHECLGHGSGQLAEGVKGGELKSYTSTLEEARADLFGLYYLGDPKMVEIGLIPSLDVAKAQYADYIMNGMMTQFSRIELGKDVEEAHMRNRKLIAEWCYEKGKENNVIEWVKQDGKSYIVVNDFDALRSLFGELLKEVQRIKSTGDYEAGRKLVEDYAVKIDYDLHKEVLERYAKLGLEPYSGFVNPDYELVEKDGQIVDVKLIYKTDYTEQMLHYSKEWSFLPTLN